MAKAEVGVSTVLSFQINNRDFYRYPHILIKVLAQQSDLIFHVKISVATLSAYFALFLILNFILNFFLSLFLLNYSIFFAAFLN